jgi:uncharacterized protein YecE (DUF72 family)
MGLYAGTSGYSYKEWKGEFYPEKIKPDEMLAFYATQLPTVEVNNTFYRMPRADMLRTWAEKVPAKFRFVVKASRRITHIKRLKNVEDEVAFLFDNLEALETKLGVVFFQLPPNFKKDLERLSAFLDILPPARVAFEFRHESWFDDEVYAALREKDCALCLADTGDEGLDVPLVSTAGWGYLRLRRPEYRKKDLEKWLSWIGKQKWKDTYVFFKHEDAGGGPVMAKKLLELAG